MFQIVGFDYDGTLADSRETAFAVTEEIARLFHIEATVRTMADYRRTFQEMERRHAPESVNADTLRALHRLLMRARAASVPLFKPVVALADQVTVETAIITSGLRATVLERIGNRHLVFGHEDGLKEGNLDAWSRGRRGVYLTDNVRDIAHCRSCGVAVIAVGWGFDTASDLATAGPDWFVAEPVDLEGLLKNLNLIKQKTL
jgi:phosphoglycolate phosphatase